jgi:hypothetical protein
VLLLNQLVIMLLDLTVSKDSKKEMIQKTTYPHTHTVPNTGQSSSFFPFIHVEHLWAGLLSLVFAFFSLPFPCRLLTCCVSIYFVRHFFFFQSPQFVVVLTLSPSLSLSFISSVHTCCIPHATDAFAVESNFFLLCRNIIAT